MLDLKEKWNELVHYKCANPYFLSSFIEQRFRSIAKDGGDKKPLLLVYSVGQEIVGIAPFVVHSWKGIFRAASFITGYDFDPDFVVQEGYREDFLYQIIDFLLGKAGCNLINFLMPSKTESFEVLLRASKSFRTYSMIYPIAGHSVIPVQMSWAEFEKERGRNFRRFFQKIERKMGSIGNWKAVLATKENSEIEIYRNILEIEMSSWKQTYRTHMGEDSDQVLLELWMSAINSSNEIEFGWHVAFLEINGKKIAYSFWIEYKDKAFICKTSFDKNYRKYYPGVYINNVVIRALFNNPKIKQIDLMTDLPFHDRWKPRLIPRSLLQISKSPISIALFKTYHNRHLKSIRHRVFQKYML